MANATTVMTMPMISPASAVRRRRARRAAAARPGATSSAGASVRWRYSAPRADDAEEQQQRREIVLPTASALRLSAIVFGSPARMRDEHDARASAAATAAAKPERGARRAQLEELAADQAAHAGSLASCVARQREEDLLERGGLHGELVQRRRRSRTRGRRPRRCVAPSDDERVRRRPRHLRPVALQRRGELGRPAASARATPRSPAMRLGDGPLLDEPAAVDDDDVVDGLLDLGEHVAGDEHRAALGGQRRAGSRAASGCPADRGRWRARRGRGPRGSPSSVAARPSRWRMPSE